MFLTGLISWFFIYVGAKLAMIQEATFARALLAAIGSGIVGWAVPAVLYAVPLLGSCSGFVIGLGASLAIIAVVFKTTPAKAFTVLVFHLFAQVVAFLLALLTFAGELHSFLTLPLPPR